MTKWYSLTKVNSSDEEKVSADAEVKPDSPWFSGDCAIVDGF